MQGVSIPTHSVRISPTWRTCPVALSSQKCQRGRNISDCLLTYEEGKQITSQFSKQPSISKLTILTFCVRRRQLKSNLSMRNCSLEEHSLNSDKVSRKDWTVWYKQLDVWQLIHYCWKVPLVRDREPHGGSAAWSSGWGKPQKLPGIPELLWRVLVTTYFPLDKRVGGKICHQRHQEVCYLRAGMAWWLFCFSPGMLVPPLRLRLSGKHIQLWRQPRWHPVAVDAWRYSLPLDRPPQWLSHSLPLTVGLAVGLCLPYFIFNASTGI